MQENMETAVTIIAAEGAGNAEGLIYGSASPALYGAAFVIALFILFSVVKGIICHFLFRED